MTSARICGASQVGLGQVDRVLGVELQRAELPVVQPQREAVDGAHAGLCGRRGELVKGCVVRQVAHRHVPAAAVGLQARPLLQLHLERLDTEDDVVGGCYEMVLSVAIHQEHAGSVYRDHLDDVINEMVEDRLDGEVTGQGPGELDENRASRCSSTPHPHNPSAGLAAESPERRASCDHSTLPTCSAWCERPAETAEDPPRSDRGADQRMDPRHGKQLGNYAG